MLVVWHDLRLLLGADVPSSEWPGIAEAFPFPGLNRHAAMKVPHHGSREAIHPSYADGDPGRFWVITPFYLQRLPRHEDANSRGEEEGLCQVLSFVDRVHLTAPPVSSRQRDRRAGHHDSPEALARGSPKENRGKAC